MAGDATSLRALRADDLPALTELWVAAWRSVLPDFDFDARRDWFAAHLDALAAAGAEIVVAEQGARLVGLLTVDPPTGYLDQIAIAPALWGTGLARTLLAHAVERAPGGLELHVNVDNPRAVRFYGREGFVTVGTGVSERSGLPILHMKRPAGPLV
ncbi:GNAT family N-acetyltransferase [Alsobacter sp. SYSU M60028]|uniref:GNAT family N-acetyltransferase n=1 Tax=Alsobacter ponti TaxID=2962936 RepID=A0ABT1LFF8_9HYPH|nr:GNAT family N-acetyltransferase [Alsobacter ponti]MCP8940164.1 GNAT family N-acetyltransferase [Alsobacter ponti]